MGRSWPSPLALAAAVGLRDPRALERPFRLILPPILTLALLQAWSATPWLGGARYAPYDPGDLTEFALSLQGGTIRNLWGGQWRAKVLPPPPKP
ncbi:hypothetical protein [Thermoflexus sp.]|uniref:hypothetical protein n=1 Tax=Thermoflexus sp. TaxID=1969742 RepID=UPI002ADD8347|nr:hypothetical protein [Thermoflexus sp.]